MFTDAYRLLVVFLAGLPSVMIAADTRTLIRHLESVPAASFHAYQLRDNNGRSMDCLEVFQIAENRNIVYGVYHSIENGVLSLHLARSVDLHHWTHITLLDAHASQAAIWPCDNGAYLLAYETDKPNSVQIRLRYYRSLHNLASAKHERQFDVPRTLAPTAEGTPSFEFVNLKQNNLDASEINIRFHFFKDAQKDQLARGVLTDFRAWKAALSDEINSELQRRNWFGNLGDRDKFTWDDKAFYLQEIQGKAGDWSSWRVCLCNEDGMPISTLSMRTHSGSTAFSNPSATWIADAMGTRKLVVTLFVLSEGSAGAEAGSLLYVIEDSKR